MFRHHRRSLSDVIEVDAASHTKVEETRELLEGAVYVPAIGKFKVFIIDEVHMLSKNSFNAMLKTLEEPPPHVKFILATTNPEKCRRPFYLVVCVFRCRRCPSS